MHAFVPHPHVDHTHPDAIVSLATCHEGERHIQRLYGERVGWIPYMRLGFTLSKAVGLLVRARPQLEGIVLGKHGLVCWGETARACYETTIRLIQEAEDYIEAHARKRVVFGEIRMPALEASQRMQVLTEILPILRGAISAHQHQVLCVE